jgi:hypothetical protein
MATRTRRKPSPATLAERAKYERRTGMNTRASIITAKALIVKPETVEDDCGNIVRVWQKSELLSWTFEQLASTLRNRVAVEPNEMLGTVPPSAIKWATNKGWIVPNTSKSLYSVTLRGAIDLNLPLRFKGGTSHGRKIPFAANPTA